MNFCPNCGSQQQNQTNFCQSCGTAINALRQPPGVIVQSAPLANSYELTPPALHWGFVLLFALLTLGFFVPFWVVYQWSFLKKVNPVQGQVLMPWVIGADVGYVLGFFISGPLPAILFSIVAIKMLPAIEGIYRSKGIHRGPLNKVAAFFLSFLYIQHHLTQIANLQKQRVVVVMQQNN